MKFYLGCHQPIWLTEIRFPLFVSHRRLDRYKKFNKKAACDWALDSGGFTELNMYGCWKTTPEYYAKKARFYYDNLGRMDWAACQDWMCEPFVLAKTGKTIEEHQTLTIDSYFKLKELDSQLPFVPILQGWEKHHYFEHVDEYLRRGIDLTQFNTVGIGSVCRRQHTEEAENIVKSLSSQGIKLHGFGFKTLGLINTKDYFASSDSMSWCITASREPRLPGCTEHIKCSNCIRFAIKWRANMLKKVGIPDDFAEQPLIYNTKYRI